MDYKIGKRTIPLHFGLDFMEGINALSGLTQNGLNLGAGAVAEQERLETMGDLSAVARVIYAATAGISPRPSLEDVRAQVETIQDDAEADALIEEITGAMKASFPLQYQVRKMEKVAKQAQAGAGKNSATK